jgi:uncharacterized repeat protein (TIGR03843 family)
VDPTLAHTRALERLAGAPLEILGRFADASNATLLVHLLDRDPRTFDELTAELGRAPAVDDLPAEDLAVYKPRRGEAPLWDFPGGTLHRREVAAYEVACAAGWDLVPPTVLREDAPFGRGSLQRFVPHDPEQHYFWLLEQGTEEVHAQLVAMVVFDLVIDNADRKGGHVLLEQPAPASTEAPAVRPGPTPVIRLVDHGVSFHVERKLRTVAWDLAGLGVPPWVRTALDRLSRALDGDLPARLEGLLSLAEVAALRARVEATASLTELPAPSGPRAYPWPLL